MNQNVLYTIKYVHCISCFYAVVDLYISVAVLPSFVNQLTLELLLCQNICSHLINLLLYFTICFMFFESPITIKSFMAILYVKARVVYV